MRGAPWLAARFGVLALVLSLAGCWRASEQQVVVYTALDREFSEPILEEFSRETGIQVLPKYDVESTKTVGLTSLILQERNRPRCDVFWNNEILHTLRLQQQGLLQAFQVPQAGKYPPAYRSDEGRWYGFAARARILIVNTELVPESERPSSIHDLVDPKWKGRAGIARPLFGTTATHAAVLFAEWGSERAEEFFEAIRDNAEVLTGNKQVAQAVANGQLAFGITDTDDAIIEIERGRPVAIIYPDQGGGEMGTLLIPNTLCILNKAPHPAEARRLVEYLLSPEVERRLAEGASAQFPLHEEVTTQPRVYQERVRWMEVDFEAAAQRWDEVSEILKEKFASDS